VHNLQSVVVLSVVLIQVPINSPCPFHIKIVCMHTLIKAQFTSGKSKKLATLIYCKSKPL
jgi:hypothetical protein